MPRQFPTGFGALMVLTCIALVGCASGRRSHTNRTATEQLLISGAVDKALNNFDFAQLKDKTVYIDDSYLEAVDEAYLVGSIRHRLFRNGAKITGVPEMADLILEARSGGIGTDASENFVGIPAIGVPGTAATLPEFKLLKWSTQFASARLGLVAYDPDTGEAIGDGGDSFARSTDEYISILGMGPFKDGSLSRDIHRMSGSRNGVERVQKSYRHGGECYQIARRQKVSLIHQPVEQLAKSNRLEPVQECVSEIGQLPVYRADVPEVMVAELEPTPAPEPENSLRR